MVIIKKDRQNQKDLSFKWNASKVDKETRQIKRCLWTIQQRNALRNKTLFLNKKPAVSQQTFFLLQEINKNVHLDDDDLGRRRDQHHGPSLKQAHQKDMISC